MDDLTLPQIEAMLVRAATTAAQNVAQKAAADAAEAAAFSSKQIEDLVEKSVRETLLQLGIDHSNPLEMQQDFQHLRAWRKSGQELKIKGKSAMLGIFFTGLGALILLGIREWLKKYS